MNHRVWVVTRGEDNEGGEVIGVCATYGGALALAAAQKSYFGPWVQDGLDKLEADEPNADGAISWSSGC
jgi:hypothetical protein